MKKIKSFVPWILLVLWCIMIFSFSGRTGVQSTKDSDKIVLYFMKNFNKDFYEIITVFIRKSAHFCLYFVLGTLALQSAHTITSLRSKHTAAVLFSFFYALSDELHQRFVPGRSCQFTDVLLDTVASLLAVLLFRHIIQNRRKKKKNN